MTRLWKVLEPDRACHNGGKGSWASPGEWMPPIRGELVPCENGYHVATSSQLIEWLGPCIHAVEVGSEVIELDDKLVAREARLLSGPVPTWNARSARLFSADCADHVSHLGEHGGKEAIRIARLYAYGRCSDAARGTAWDAAQDAAWGDAWGTALGAALAAVQAAAWNAAWAAARSAAQAAARADAREDAWEDAWAKERQWQIQRLFAYLDGRIVV